jgi:hypothetical protein
LVTARVDHLLRFRQSPAREFASESAGHDVVTLAMEPNDRRCVRMEHPEQVLAVLVPELQQTVGPAGHHEAIDRER